MRGLDDIDGVREYTIPTRPINHLISRIEKAEKTMLNDREDKQFSLVVVGGGFAGIEMALTLRNRWRNIISSSSLSVTIINSDSQLLSSESSSCRDFMNKILQKNNITVLNSTFVSKITKTAIEFGNNDISDLPYTHCIWAAGKFRKHIVKI